MVKGHVVMGLLFFPRGGSAQVARYVSTALVRADWSVELVTGSLGVAGEETHAPTFFAGTPVQHLDYADAVEVFAAGGSAIAAPVPMHPSYEDRLNAPDVLFAAVPPELAGHLSSVWEAPFRTAGADGAHVFHLHHLTPQHDALRRCWPRGAVVTHLHGTEIKFLEGVNERAALARSVGTTLADMPEWRRANPGGCAKLGGPESELLRTTRWEQWRHGEAWHARLLAQAQAADHLVVVSPTDRSTAVELLRVDADRVSDVPNGVDVTRFCPRRMSRQERRAHFRRWLVEDPQGWDETATPGTVAYREPDLDQLLGPEGDAIVLIFVGRFTSAKRVPLLVRAFARAWPCFNRSASLLIWGGHPGEWEGEHPVTVARGIGAHGVYFAGWRGHDDLPQALAACDALVMPSVDDSYSQAALEAMAVGLPVIATDSGGFPYMVNLDPARPTGWLVSPDDERALSEMLVDVVNGPQEISRRGDAALAHARAHLSWASRVDGFEEAYARARDRRGRRCFGVAGTGDRLNRAP
ncbi:MAG TPA: glycosyltransferase family 4 protein [Acidimicrobiia bacterium]|nr:glycosyltransferase family 4 protein [Acidimicrobiia bacterium]